MGYFSDIISEARQEDEERRPYLREPQPTEGQIGITDNPVPETPAPAEIKEEAPASTEEAAPAPEPAPAPVIDLNTDDTDEAERRRAHEAAEAKRKAEWEAKQQEKRQAEQEALRKLEGMTDEQISADAAKRVAADTEKLTRRNMKEMVCEHIQDLCAADAAFARKVIHPRKSMIRCFKYINRKAREYAEQEMKDQGIERTGVYGCDVPDGLCYQWAVDYFNDPDAAEDKEGEEKFVPKPYVSKSGKSKPKTAAKKPAEKPEPKKDVGMQQMSLLEEVL